MPGKESRTALAASARGLVRAGVLLLSSAALISVATQARGAILAPRPGPIDRPLHLVAADFDRDGFDDLAIANFESGTITILINQRDGTFAPHPGSPLDVGGATLNFPTSGPLRMAVGDLDPEDADRDGVPNVTRDASGNVTARDDCPFVYNPADATTGLQADADGNGIGDACQVLTTDSSGNPMTIDTDGDGVPDYDPVTNSLDNCPFVYNPLQEDANSDGVGDACPTSDIVILELGTPTQFGAPPSQGFIRVKVNDGSGGFTNSFSKLAGVAPVDILLADFTGDGRPEMVASNSVANYLQIHTGMTNATFSSQSVIFSGQRPAGLAAGDFNGDNADGRHRDLAVANQGVGTVGVYLNTGQAIPAQPSVSVPTSAPPATVLAADLDLDGRDDLVVLEEEGNGTGAIEVFRGSPSGPSATAAWFALMPAGHQPRGGVVRDLDGDGFPDLAVDDFSGGQVLLYKGVGDGTFATSAITLTVTGLTNPAAILALDYDPDDPAGRRPDLAVLDFATNLVELFHNDSTTGTLLFSAAPTTPEAPWKGSTTLAIYGADRQTGNDIVLLQTAQPIAPPGAPFRQAPPYKRPDLTPRLQVLSGIGNGFFRALPFVPLSGPGHADGLVVGDLRLDNFFDVMITDTAGDQITIVTGDPSGVPVERQTLKIAAGAPTSTALGSLISGDDYDRDGVPDLLDDCPTIYNPPGCKVTDASCSVQELCTDPLLAPTDCAITDPLTGQCDSDGNGIGDQCQVLSATCTSLDTDGDIKEDYNPFALRMLNGTTPDFDNDGNPNDQDNCPTVANPLQEDANLNGIGDACEVRNGCVPSPPCEPNQACSDPEDGDGKCAYDSRYDDPNFPPAYDPANPTALRARIAAALDNCPSLYNPGQEDNDGDGVGNTCVIRAALDDCLWAANQDQADTGFSDAAQTFPAGIKGNNIGDICDGQVNDAAVVSAASGRVTLLTGDGSGSFREARFSPLSGFSNPSAALIGQFSLLCPTTLGCTTNPNNDLVVAERRGTDPAALDDDLVVAQGDGTGSFSRIGVSGARGDPTALMALESQEVCGNPHFGGMSDSGLRFDPVNRSNIIVSLQPGPPAGLGIYLVSNFGLVAPPAHTLPLPVPAPLVGVAFADLNRDGIEDLVALSSGDGDPNTPNVTIYIGIGNGLFFTDPSFNPTGTRDGMTLIGTGHIDLANDVFFPDVALYDAARGQPLVLINTMLERADIDGSGRVDGLDLALLARAFGTSRGEDFTILPDGTLRQSGTDPTDPARIVLGTGSATLGQDLCHRTDPANLGSPCFCSSALEVGSGASGYGIPVDVNLDGQVDGTDLAFLARLFGSRL